MNDPNADYEIGLCTTRGVVQFVVRDVVAKPVVSYSSTSTQCSSYTVSRQLIEQRSETISRLAILRGVEPLNEFILRCKRVESYEDELGEPHKNFTAGTSVNPACYFLH